MQKSAGTWILVAAVVSGALALPGALLAQGANATLSGTVKDETGAIVPGAAVVVRNVDTSLRRELLTDGNGHFSAPNLPPGPYEATVSVAGFSKLVRSGIRLTVGSDTAVTLSLRVGQREDKVEVRAEAPAIETTSGSTGTLISGEQIRGLPLNGRSFIELATLTPGVQLTQVGGRTTSTGFGVKLSVNGARYTQNLFTLDGTMLNDQFNQAGSASGNVLGVEAIREFRVITNSFSAEYGRHTGGVINAATKSGTNAIHGSLFEFHRNDALDSRNFFDQEGSEPDFVRNQFGVSLGGPIQRDKTFFFATYEGLRESLGQTLIFNVPSESLRASPTVDPAIRPYLQSFPLPNGRALGTTRGEYVTVSTRKTDEHYAMLRLDRQFGPGSRAFVRYTFDDGEVVNPGRVNTGETTKTRVHFVTVEHDAVRGSNFVNRAQFGLTRSRLDGFDYVLDGATLPRQTFTDITRGIATISVTGLAPWGGNTTNPKLQTFTNFQLSDTVTWLQGRHNLKAGATLEVMHYDYTSDFTSMGNYTFNSLDDFVANRPATFEAIMPGSDASRRLRQKAFGMFVQDDFRVTPRLTLNLGLRYEPTTRVTETEGRLAQLIDFGSPTASLRDATVVEALFQNPSKRTIAPRLGFAWDPLGSGKMAIRGGAGIFYDIIVLNTPFVQNTAVRVPPFINRGGLQAPTRIDFPNAYTTQRTALAGQVALEGIQYDLDQPRMYKWNLNVQRELPGRLAVEVGYTGTHGQNLVRQIFTNGRVAATDADGRLFVRAGTPLRQPNFQRMRYRVSDGTSDYHGLTVSVSRRSTNLNMQASYTWSKAIDTGAAALGNNDFDNEGGGSRYLFTKDRGLSPFDVRHSFVGNLTYELPFGKATGPLSAVVRGWNVGTLVRARSGYPFSVFTGVDRGLQQFAPRYPDLRPGASNNPILGGADRYFDPTAFVLQPAGYIGNLGRNTLMGPGLFTVDFVVERSIRIGSGGRTLQLRAEVFNLTNRVNLALPSSVNLFDARGNYLEDAGRITSTSTSARQAQLGVKFVW
jgi:hypothetical protein